MIIITSTLAFFLSLSFLSENTFCRADLSRFFQECACIKPFEDSIRNYSAINVQACYVACLAERMCVDFSYSVSETFGSFQIDIFDLKIDGNNVQINIGFRTTCIFSLFKIKTQEICYS